ncbi:MAG: response regulator transcription factor [Mycobacterium sp.]|nr:response regulator transcription factor [Mycobacterium sp.]
MQISISCASTPSAVIRTTPAELAVVRLLSEGLTNKEIATRLFVSPHTVHTHIYTKLGLTSRLQLAQQATRHL